jgi:hypothetical protein
VESVHERFARNLFSVMPTQCLNYAPRTLNGAHLERFPRPRSLNLGRRPIPAQMLCGRKQGRDRSWVCVRRPGCASRQRGPASTDRVSVQCARQRRAGRAPINLKSSRSFNAESPAARSILLVSRVRQTTGGFDVVGLSREACPVHYRKEEMRHDRRQPRP